MTLIVKKKHVKYLKQRGDFFITKIFYVHVHYTKLYSRCWASGVHGKIRVTRLLAAQIFEEPYAGHHNPARDTADKSGVAGILDGQPGRKP
jgi:hypothetical protein